MARRFGRHEARFGRVVGHSENGSTGLPLLRSRIRVAIESKKASL
jgi:hypothetical protein